SRFRVQMPARVADFTTTLRRLRQGKPDHIQPSGQKLNAFLKFHGIAVVGLGRISWDKSQHGWPLG
ncbi:MAG TPA: hypothetical protein PLM33_06030, partial [Acidobacteriota bacterium]|nr:hypothetical protein [Acidobacteriota bacterium]